MKLRMMCTFIALLGCLLISACRSPGPLPPHRTMEPTVPPVAYTAPAEPTRSPAESLIVSETSFSEMGLIWRECQVSEEGYTDWRQAEACFGRAAPSWSEEDQQRFGTRTESGLGLTVGDDVFEVCECNRNILRWSTLMKNGWPVRVLLGATVVHSPNISLQEVAGRIAWEFAGEDQKTIIHGGKDVRPLYDLDAAYRPYGIDGKLVFVGEKDGSRFVMVDGKRMGPEFDEIIVAYCCEPAAYSVRFGDGRYAFWGTRGERRYVVELCVH